MKPGAPDRDQVEHFERAYAGHDEANRRWRTLTAEDNVSVLMSLLSAVGVRHDSVLDIGSGDGALLAEFAARGLGRRYVAYEISASAVDLVRARDIPGVERVEVFDGYHLREEDGAFDLVILTTVIEHARRPDELLAEAIRVSPTLLVSVILDDTLASRRRRHHEAATSIGRVHRFSAESTRTLLSDAGLEIVAEEIRPASFEAMTFWARGRAQRTRAHALAALKHAIHRVAPSQSQRIYSHSYYAACRTRPPH